jgi:hypothetical protein
MKINESEEEEESDEEEEISFVSNASTLCTARFQNFGHQQKKYRQSFLPFKKDSSFKESSFDEEGN